jgi:drug/metabolite transporter (DMT)-like permease
MGELAGLFTSIFWSFTSVQFTFAGRMVGSAIVNRVRLLLAILYLSALHWWLYGHPWPVDAEGYRWIWLGLSGVIGLVLGDGALFQAFVMIGPRLATLLMTLAPVLSALLAWLWLGETLKPVEILAIFITIAGVAWVVSERGDGGAVARRRDRQFVLGVLFGLIGALGQATGLVTAKHGLTGGFPSLSATLVRMLVAAAVIWLFTLLRGGRPALRRSFQIGKAWPWVLGGSVTGPFLGVWFSMIAVQNANVGIASTLTSLSPIMLIPLAHWFFKERISPRSVVGTIIALAGAAVIFLT